MGDVLLKYFTMKQMLVDHFTKPLQGGIFKKFRTELMYIPEDIDINDLGSNGIGMKAGVTWKQHGDTDPTCPQECVGEHVSKH